MSLHNLVFYIFVSYAIIHFTIRWVKTRQKYLLWGILLFAGLAGSRLLETYEHKSAAWVLEIAALVCGYLFAIHARREVRKDGE